MSGPCGIEGCDRPSLARGWCALHYQRWRVSGDPLIETPRNPIRHGHKTRNGASREYVAWLNMKRRCFDPTCDKFQYYCGRGITVCDQWRESFDTFLADVGRCPPRMTIDRIDNNGNYEPANVRWATHRQQCNNRRSTRLFVLNGRIQSLAQWAAEYGMNRRVVQSRLRIGWDIETALTTARYSKYGNTKETA